MSEAEKKVKKLIQLSEWFPVKKTKKTTEEPAPEVAAADGAEKKKKKKVDAAEAPVEAVPADGTEKKKKKKADAEAPAEATPADGVEKKKKKKTDAEAPVEGAVATEEAPAEGEKKKKKKKTEEAPTEAIANPEAAHVETGAAPTNAPVAATGNPAELVFNNVRSKEYAESIAKLISVIAKHKGSVNVTVHLGGAPTAVADERSAQITRRLNEFLQQLDQPSA